MCSRESNYGLLDYKEKVIIKFDKFQRVKQHVSINSYIYKTLEDAQNTYNSLDDKEGYKLNYSSGLAREMSFQSDTITNRKRIKTSRKNI